MMQESEFHALADRWLMSAQDALDEADSRGVLDVDMQQGALTIGLDSGQVYVISKHAPSAQLWLSSPASGGLHFSHDESLRQWVLADGRRLDDILAGELEQCCGLRVAF